VVDRFSARKQLSHSQRLPAGGIKQWESHELLVPELASFIRFRIAYLLPQAVLELLILTQELKNARQCTRRGVHSGKGECTETGVVCQ